MRQTLINGRWEIVLPDHRADFHEQRPWWEAARLADMYKHVDRSMSVMDVGSEEGDFTALYATWTDGHVGCIDPSAPWVDDTFEIIQANGIDTSPVRFYIGFAGDHTSIGGEFGQERRFYDYNPDWQTYALRDIFQFDVYVVDVEGSEDKVLQGADLERDAIWYLSIHGDVDPHAVTPSKIHGYMRQFGFKDQWLGHQHEWFYRFWK